MHRLLLVGCVAFGLTIASACAEEVEDFSLGDYTCSEFLNDATTPEDGAPLVRSLMMIAWATGYAAAHHEGSLRADGAAIRLIGATLGEACRVVPEEKVVEVTSAVISDFLEAEAGLADVASLYDDDDFDVLVNIDLYGEDISPTPFARDVTLDECKAGCLGEWRCRAFTYNEPARACFLKSGAGERTRFPGAISGLRR